MSRCRNGIAPPNIFILQKETTLWPENMVTLSRQYCRVPSSAYREALEQPYSCRNLQKCQKLKHPKARDLAVTRSESYKVVNGPLNV